VGFPFSSLREAGDVFQLIWRIRGTGRTADVAGTSQMGNAMTDDVATTIQIDNARTGHVAAFPSANVLGIM
jgi:hypothetical protein